MKSTSDILKEIFEHAFDMQKLADTKNAGLIAFNGAVIIGMIKLSYDFKAIPYLFWYFIFVMIMCTISIFLNLTSLVAQLRHKISDVSLVKSDNLMFFGTIAQMNPDELINAIKNKYKTEIDNQEYCFDLARQSVIISQIATRKFKLFNKAFLWTIAGIATPLSTLVFEIFFNPNKK